MTGSGRYACIQSGLSGANDDFDWRIISQGNFTLLLIKYRLDGARSSERVGVGGGGGGGGWGLSKDIVEIELEKKVRRRDGEWRCR